MNEILGIISLLSISYLIFLIPQLIILGILSLNQKARASIRNFKITILSSYIIPYTIWMLAMILDGKGKSLSNALYEPILIGFILALINILFIIRSPKTKIYWISSLIIIPLLVYFLVPQLPL